MPDDDKVGYKRPPKTNQFKKGKSGNPRGRPKHTRNIKRDLAEELASRISITVQGRAATVSKQRAVIMASIARAIKGDMHAAALIFNLVRQLLEPDAQSSDDAKMRASPADQEIVEAFLERHLTPIKGGRAKTASAETSIVDPILRTDFPSFIEKCFHEINGGRTYLRNWHIEAIAHELERCRTGANTRLIITVPPRSLKSICASIAFPAFLLGHDPTQRLINVSYSQELGAKLTSGFRHVVNSNWYRRIFAATRAVRDTEGEFEATRGGRRVSISIKRIHDRSRRQLRRHR